MYDSYIALNNYCIGAEKPTTITTIFTTVCCSNFLTIIFSLYYYNSPVAQFTLGVRAAVEDRQ